MASSANAKETQELISALTNAVSELHNLSVVVEHFQEESQGVLFKKINNFVTHLQAIDKLNSAVDIAIPVELLDVLDKPTENNPELYTKSQLEKCEQASEKAQARIESLELLKQELESAMLAEGIELPSFEDKMET